MIDKQYFLNNKPENLALTGRVQDWLNNPERRLPVSCTVMSVDDSMEGENGIEASWRFTSHGLRNAAGISVNLNNLRGKDTDNGKGLISSGAVSFAKIYSVLNETLRRGGLYKNGGISIFLDYDHPDIEDFLNATSSDLPWAKKAVYIDKGIENHPILPLLAEKVNQGSVWLAKKVWDRQGNRLYSNLCLEILLESRGTCLLSHINLGAFKNPELLPSAFADSMKWLCELHAQTGVGETGEYLPPTSDKQVGLGVIGLANLLAIHKVSYEEFVTDLENINAGVIEDRTSIAFYLKQAFDEAASIAKSYGMKRAFTVAPTANMHRNYQDADGFTVAAEISPPLGHFVDRDSALHGVQTYEFHPKTEIAKNVGWDVQWRLLNAWQDLMESTGLAHSISANLWNSIKITPEWITDVFLPSSVVTTYYRLQVEQSALDKSQVITVDSSEKKKDTVACSINKDDYQNEYCSSCGG